MEITLQNLSKNVKALPKKSQTTPQNTNFTPIKRNPQNIPTSLIDKNYNQLLVKPSKVNFKRNLPIAPHNDIPIDKKISSVLQIMQEEDLLLVGKNLKESKELLKESIGNINKVIKRFFVIEDKNLNANFAITHNKGSNEIINLEKKPFFLKSDTEQYIAKKGDNLLLLENDKIIVDKKEIPVATNSKEDLSLVRQFSVKPFDFSSHDKKTIQNLNIKHIDQLETDLNIKSAKKKLTFNDIGGQDAAIAELKKSVIFPIKYPNAFKNSTLNRGIILTGGPGTGKTLAAEALANEANAHYIQLNGLEMESKWVGESEENWRNLFAQAKENQPSVIFIDEFDAVAKKREGSSSSRYDDKVVNQLLTLMSDAEKGKMGEVFVVVATNKLDLLDDAIVRSGRFGKHIPMEKPNLKGCKDIFNIHTQNKPLSEKLKADEIAKNLHEQKASGADISHIVNEAHQKAYERAGIFEKMDNGTFKDEDIQNLKIEPEDFTKAIDDFKAQNNLSVSKKERPVVGYKQTQDLNPKAKTESEDVK